MPVTLRGASPVLVNVTVCAALVELTGWIGNPRLATETEACGVAFAVPVSVIACGLLAALSVIVTEPKRLPNAVGVNVTLIVQFAPAARLAGQLLSWAKSPLATTFEMIRGAVPVLFRATDWAALVAPIDWPANVSVLAERLATGTAWPAPDNRTF